MATSHPPYSAEYWVPSGGCTAQTWPPQCPQAEVPSRKSTDISDKFFRQYPKNSCSQLNRWSVWCRKPGWNNPPRWVQQRLSWSKVSGKWQLPAMFHRHCPECRWWSSTSSKVYRRKSIEIRAGILWSTHHYRHILDSPLAFGTGRGRPAHPYICGRGWCRSRSRGFENILSWLLVASLGRSCLESCKYPRLLRGWTLRRRFFKRAESPRRGWNWLPSPSWWSCSRGLPWPSRWIHRGRCSSGREL